MNRVVINEVDLTNTTPVNTVTDVVYVPGFSISETLKAFQPVLCTNIYEFNNLVGSQTPMFLEDQYYPEDKTYTVTVKDDEGNDVEKTIDRRVKVGKDGNYTNYYFSKDSIPDAGGSLQGTVMFGAGTADPSYIYAKELVTAGIPVLYERINTVGQYPEEVVDTDYQISVADAYRAFLEKIFTDKIESSDYISNILHTDYQFKYLTSGGYPVYEFGYVPEQTNPKDDQAFTNVLANSMAVIAQLRGDCVALIDHTDNPERPLVGKTSIFGRLNHNLLPSASMEDTFATMFTPYASFTLSSGYSANFDYPEGYPIDPELTFSTNNILPGSFAYLISLARSLRTNPNWLSIAGVSRGAVPNLNQLHTASILTNSVAEAYQPDGIGEEKVCLNAITRIGNYGYCIWGNRTLQQQNPTRVGFATRFLNIRNLLSDIKKQARTAALELMFEQNTEILWANFKSKLTPLLDSMVSGSGLSSYKIIRDTEQSTKTKLAAIIKVYPVYSVEAFVINISISDEEITVE